MSMYKPRNCEPTQIRKTRLSPNVEATNLTFVARIKQFSLGSPDVPTYHSSSTLTHDAVFNAYEQRRLKAKQAAFDLRRLKMEECIELILKITISSPAVIVVNPLPLPKASSNLVSKSTKVIKTQY